MSYAVLKALHIVFVVTWFAGLFYIVRLLIYIQEAHDKPAHERDVLLPQLKLMSRGFGKASRGPRPSLRPSWAPPSCGASLAICTPLGCT